MLTAEKMAEWCGGIWQGGGIPACINGFCIDTRLIQSGDIFIALSGDDRDGHDYLDAAFDGGAVAAIIAKNRIDASVLPGACLLVKDPAEALIEISTNYRKEVNPKIIAVTGSVGKSTVKELIAQILATTFKTAKTNGNWNNNIGLPLSILGMEPDTEVAVFELGMNHPGEIEVLCRIAEPDCSVITNVGPVHLEFFGSVKDIAIEKSVVLKKTSGNGVCFLDIDSDFFELLNGMASCEVRTVSVVDEADYCVLEEDLITGTIHVREKVSGNKIILPMPLPSGFNVMNVLFAVGVARWMGVSWESIISALSNYKAMPMRWDKVISNNLLFINDAYNANPISMRAAIETFCTEYQSRNKWLVLGGMLELGDCEYEEHTALGKFIAEISCDGLIVIGKLGCIIADSAERSGMSVVIRCENTMEAANLVKKNIVPESAVLLKGSRSFKLEQVIDKLNINNEQ